AKKVGFKLNPDKKAKEKNLSTQLTKGPVAKNDSSILRLIILSGYDKHASSSVESFFISNKSDHNISGITLDINYLTPDNRQLHKRTEEIILYIPAGETRMAEIKSWDKQKSFHYIKSQPSRKPSSPYKVTITPLSVLIDK
ncbi:MAG: hypothetical protein K2N03_03880, partial [Muribaculaceae bacterium]|nr:hypothetical protein [Muribaculaceae bacterium]